MPESYTTPEQIKQVDYQLNNLTLTALTCGDPSDKPILCLHGYLDNAASFLPLMQASKLLPNRYIIALDFAGHGHSSHRSADAHYHFFDYLSDLAELFVVKGWLNLDVVGHSMGAMIASAFAAAFPEKVKSLTLIDSLGFISEPIPHTTKQLRKGILSRFPSNNLRKAFTEESAIKARMYVSDLNFHCAQTIIKRSIINTVADLDKTPIDLDNKLAEKQYYFWRSDPKLRAISPYRLSLQQGQQLYKDIQCPVQLIYGEQGMKMVQTGIKHYSPYLNSLLVNKISGGHHVHMEKPNLLLKLMKSFYERMK